MDQKTAMNQKTAMSLLDAIDLHCDKMFWRGRKCIAWSLRVQERIAKRAGFRDFRHLREIALIDPE